MILSIVTFFAFLLIIMPFQRLSIIGNSKNFLDKDHTTYYKGIAILLVMLSHTINATGETVFATPLGGIGVAMFLFLSGYGLQESFKKNGLHGFWKKKILRIFIPYALLIAVVRVIRQDFDIVSFLKDIFFIQSTYWYIGYLIKWYIVFYLASLFGEKYKFYILSCGAVLSFTLLPEIQAEQSLSFSLGVVASFYLNRIVKTPAKFWYIIGTSLLVIGVLTLGIKQTSFVRDSEWLMKSAQLLIKLPVALAIIILIRDIMRKNLMIKYCGVLSLELYLVHMQALYLIQKGSLHEYILTLILFFAVTAVTAYVFHSLNKRITA